MRCPVCSHANPDDARFCSNCGNQLELTCPACSAPYEPGQKFCNQCGTKLADTPVHAPAAPDDLSRWVPDELLRKIRAAQSGQTMRGERRTVTMLFADIQGSTSAAEQLDPEEWAEIVNDAFGVLIEPIYRYEGTLARLQGDAILAFFGAPIAHEDDPLRAVRAGLDIVRGVSEQGSEAANRLGVPISVRVGINTGLVVVGEVGSDLRVEYTALGDAINVAARMEQTAEPGTVRVTQETLELLGPGVTSESLGPVDVKGRAEPVLAHRISAVTERAVGAEAASTPLVGRDDELDKLGQLVERLTAGLGGICTIVGEAGIGKTRLLLSLRDRLPEHVELARVSGEPGSLAWLEARARSYETALPHAMFRHLLSPWLGGTDALASPGRLEQALADVGIEDEDHAAFLASLLEGTRSDRQQAFLDSLEPNALHVRTNDAVIGLLAAEARSRPVVVVMDDVHWADSLSLELVERVMELTEASPVLAIIMTRPMHEDPSWRVIEVAARDHGHRHTHIELEALPADASGVLLAALLDDLEVDDELHADILERTSGNPLFVEEMARALSEAHEAGRLDARQLTVPRTLTSLLTSRLDRLEESTRHVAQLAAVCGREFSITMLSALAEDPAGFAEGVRELVRRGVFEERRGIPEPVYAFRHPLIAETAYNTVLLKTRRQLHERMARHLEQHEPDSTPEIARHWVEAGQPTVAFPHLIDAGLRANRIMALRDAIGHFTLALDHIPEDADPELVARAHDGLGEAYARVPDLSQASSAYQSLLEHGRQTDRPTMQVTALNRLGFTTAAISGDLEKAMDYLQEARALAEECGDDMGLAEYHMNACFVAAAMGNVDEAILHDEQTVRLGSKINDRDIHLTGLLRRTQNLVVVLRFEEAEASYRDGIAAAEEVGDELQAALLHTEAEAMFALRDGRIADAVEIIRAHVPAIDRALSNFGGIQHERLGAMAMLLGDFELALAEYAATDRFGQTVGQRGLTGLALAGRAHALAVLDPEAEISELHASALEIALSPYGEYIATGILADLADANLQRGDLDAAAQDLERAWVSSSVMRKWEEPRILLRQARVSLLRAEREEAAQQLERARAHVAKHGMLLHEPEMLLLDGWVAELDGRDEDAATVLTEAVRAATESGRRPLRIEALRRLASVRRRQGDLMEATALDERADTVVRDIASGIADEALRHSWEQRSLVADRPASS